VQRYPRKREAFLSIEAALIAVGRELGKQIVRVWMVPRSASQERDSSLAELVAFGVPDQIRRRKLKRQIEDISDKVAERLSPFCEHEFRTLTVEDKQAAILIGAECLASAKLDDRSIFAEDMEPERVIEEILRQSGQQLRSAGLGEDGEKLCELVIRESGTILCKTIQQLPTYTPRALTEMLQRSSRISDDIAEILDRVPRASLMSQRGTAFDGEFQTRYKAHISVTQDHLELFGLDTRNYRLRTAVTTAFLSLNVRMEGRLETGDRLEVPAGLSLGRESKVESALHSNNRLLIRGDAGCGKTTLLQWLAVSAARGTFGVVLSDWNGLTPFVVRLRSYGGKSLPRPENFVDLVASPLSGLMPDGWVHRQLESGHVLLLIDGVDEVITGERPRVKRWLSELLAAYPNLRVVVTTRPAAATETWLANEGFASASVEPMTTSDIEVFCARWHDAVREASIKSRVSLPCHINELASYRRAVMRHLESRKHLKMLATNPLMCAMLCALNLDRRKHLPPDRMRIYADAIQLLLDRRDAERDVPSAFDINLSLTQKLSILQYLAWRTSEAGRAELPRSEAIEHVRRALGRISDVSLEPSLVLDYLLTRSGILREPVPGRIDFVHRTFQEYLTAKECAEDHTITALINRAHLDQWRETVIMAVGHVTGPLRSQLIDGVLDRALHEPRHSRRLRLLAAACLETVSVLPGEIADRIGEALAAVTPPRARREARSVALAGERALAHFPESPDGVSSAIIEACIYASAYIGGNSAISLLSSYASDPRWQVQNALQAVWDYFDPHDYAREVLSMAPLAPWRNGESGSVTVSRPEQVPALPELKNLKAVTVNFDRMESLDLESLTDVSNLTTLFVTPERPLDLTPLQVHSELVSIVLTYGAGVDRGIEVLSNLPKLRRVNLSLESAPKSAVDDVLALKHLEDLELWNTSIAGGLGRVQHLLPQLTDIGFHGCSDISDLSLLEGTKIRWLRLENCPVSNLRPLLAMPALRTLILEGEPTGHIGDVVDHPNLRTLMMHGRDSIELSEFAHRSVRHSLKIQLFRRNRVNVSGSEHLPTAVKLAYL
jgi:hypothetical protein